MDINERARAALELVQEAEALAVGESVQESFDPSSPRSRDYKLVIEGPKVRVWHDRSSFVVEEMPGKPVKRRVKWVYQDLGGVQGLWHHGGGVKDPKKRAAIKYAANAYIPENILQNTRLSEGMSFEQAVAALKKGVDHATGIVAKVFPGIYEYHTDKWYPRERSFLEVVPTNTEPIKVKVGSFEGTARWAEFGFRSYAGGNGPHDHDPTYTDYDSASPAAARKLYKILKANPDALNGVKDLGGWLTKKKIKFKTGFSVYR